MILKAERAFSRAFFVLSAGLLVAALFSCARKSAGKEEESFLSENLPGITSVGQSHEWYAFSGGSLMKVSSPSAVARIPELPWTEAVRISSAAGNFALVNRLGMLEFNGGEALLHRSLSSLGSVTADGMVLSGGNPVFYVYRSPFFNTASQAQGEGGKSGRVFLMEYSSSAGVFFPLVLYSNLNLDGDYDIVSYFWDGKTWVCGAKKADEDKKSVEFRYFSWQPEVPLTELSPALSEDYYIFRESSESVFSALTSPRDFSASPSQLKALLSSVPSDFSFFVSWRNSDFTSPVNFYHTGKGSLSVRGRAFDGEKYSAAVFEDGTVYIRSKEGAQFAFRLPRLPAGFIYTEAAVSGDFFYSGWEESDFYKTGRTGFIKVDLNAIAPRS